MTARLGRRSACRDGSPLRMARKIWAANTNIGIAAATATAKLMQKSSRLNITFPKPERKAHSAFLLPFSHCASGQLQQSRARPLPEAPRLASPDSDAWRQPIRLLRQLEKASRSAHERQGPGYPQSTS